MANQPGHPSSAALRASIVPGAASHNPRPSTSTANQKNRHLSHLHSQLAQLSANLADLESVLRMTAVQAESMRGLGGWTGGLFMAASKVLGEETISRQSQATEKEHREDRT